MTSVRKLRAHAVLTSLPLFVLACSTGKPPGDDDYLATGGSTSGNASTGGSAATATGGASAAAGLGGSAASAGAGGVSAAAGVGGSSAAAGGDTSAGGTGGASAAGGDAGTAALGGASGAAAMSGMGGSSGTDPGVCQSLNVIYTPQVPTVEILVDDSSSMYEPDNVDPTPWKLLYTALMHETEGAIKPLEGKVRFGFASFRSPKNISVPEGDDSCAQIVTVPYALSNYEAIDTVYAAVGLDARFPQGCGATPNGPGCGQTQWDTPTGHSINKVATDLAAYVGDPPGKKFILFVTDGTPNTCLVGDPNCGQDVAVAAVQTAFTKGIGTFVIGLGNIINEQCDAQAGRCGVAHLQDIANAGMGLPVAPPPNAFWYQQCATMQSGTNPGVPVATYADTEAGAGMAPYFTATNVADLREAISGLLNDLPCTIDMDAVVTGDPTLGKVNLDSSPLAYDDPNGWKLEANAYSVTLQGTACDAYKAGGQLAIDFPCDGGKPIAVRR